MIIFSPRIIFLWLLHLVIDIPISYLLNNLRVYLKDLHEWEIGGFTVDLNRLTLA